MFTGIVEKIGTVSALVKLDETETGGGGTSLTISDAAEILTDVHLGDSIAVNGTCLTVTEFTSDSFKVGVAPETLRRTNLGELTTGSPVNLERAVAGDIRFGGHFVQGHVDTVATILAKTPDGNALTVRFQPRDPEVLVYIVEKGYITLDGASLTITAVNDEEKWFEVMLVAYTQEKIIIPRKEVGQTVNLEVDMAGKYVEKQVKAQLEKGLAGMGLEKLVENIVKRTLKDMKIGV
ncbi:alpha subunit of riboflavin synthase [Ascodesmis nigricans]|uniref:Riboflavin synthase n=1 Tax=Ascodesmis nigricans TaxID=341454 RepID=A0A4V3SII5_9PEZI|nr:alpha subunit of riboflavin synthase [Ascodesmis nigricans]